MRIFFGNKQSWLSWLTRPIRVLIISVMALLLVVVAIAVTATRTSGKLATASDVGVTLNGLAVNESSDKASAVDEDRGGKPGTRNTTRGTRRTNSERQQPKKPSVLSRAKNKLKKILKNPF
jgi:hypothetical protein